MSGEVHLRRRGDGATELRVGGQFVMDDVETTSERLLARHVAAQDADDVLVGGLGLGYTVRELLDGEVRHVVVAELHPEVVEAVEAGAGAGPLDDSRLEVVVGDVRDVVTDRPTHSLDAICLDVDNGPEQLVHEENAALYAPDFLAVCRDRLRPGGTLTVWSATPAALLARHLGTVFDDVRTVRVPVRLGPRESSYWLLEAA